VNIPHQPRMDCILIDTPPQSRAFEDSVQNPTTAARPLRASRFLSSNFYQQRDMSFFKYPLSYTRASPAPRCSVSWPRRLFRPGNRRNRKQRTEKELPLLPRERDVSSCASVPPPSGIVERRAAAGRVRGHPTLPESLSRYFRLFPPPLLLEYLNLTIRTGPVRTPGQT